MSERLKKSIFKPLIFEKIAFLQDLIVVLANREEKQG